MTQHLSLFFRHLSKFISGTLISRLSGFAREVAMAAYFGTNPCVAAFWMAYRFANLFRRLFGEGGLHMAFVPHFEQLRHHDEAHAIAFFRTLKKSLFYLLFLLILVIEAFLYLGSSSITSPQTLLILHFTRLLLPLLLFISLYALNAALLHCYKQFFLPSVAPTIVNILWASAVIACYRYPLTTRLTILCIWLLLAFALQWLVTWYRVRSIIRPYLQEPLVFREVFAVLRSFPYVLLGIAAAQINTLCDAFFATITDSRGSAILWYALRVQQVPLAFLGVGVSSAMLPLLSQLISSRQEGELRSFFHSSLLQILSWVIPMTCLLWILAPQTIFIIYQRGAFDATASYATSQALRGYLSGLPPMILILLCAALFYSKKEYAIPLYITLASILANLILNTVFVYGLGWHIAGIAYATSLAAWIQLTLYLFVLVKDQVVHLSPFVPYLIKIACASLIGSCCYYLPTPGPSFIAQLISCASIGGVFCILYLGTAYLFKIETYREMFMLFKKH